MNDTQQISLLVVSFQQIANSSLMGEMTNTAYHCPATCLLHAYFLYDSWLTDSAIKSSLIVPLTKGTVPNKERQRINRTLKMLCGSVSEDNGPTHYKKNAQLRQTNAAPLLQKYFFFFLIGLNKNRCEEICNVRISRHCFKYKRKICQYKM